MRWKIHQKVHQQWVVKMKILRKQEGMVRKLIVKENTYLLVFFLNHEVISLMEPGSSPNLN